MDEDIDFEITGQMPVHPKDTLARKLKNKIKEENNNDDIEIIGQTFLHLRNRLARKLKKKKNWRKK